MNYSNNKKGYTLLFAIIVSSVILSIAAFVLSTSRKQFIISSATRDSTIAVYASDSAIQCAVDAYNRYMLATTTKDGVPQMATIECFSNVSQPFTQIDTSNPGYDSGMSLAHGSINGTNYLIHQTQEPIQISFFDNTCARVTVTDGYDSTTLKHKTIIDSRGYNFSDFEPCSDSELYNPRSVERAIRLQYFD